MKLNKIILYIVFFFVTTHLYSSDWPMWRNDPGHTGTTGEKLPQKLVLKWQRDLGTPAPAWPASQTKLQFDKSYEPVVSGKMIFVPSMNSDKVTAFHTETGKEIWRFYADAPVRFAPVIFKDKLFFISDDGNLYCIGTKTGKLIRKFNAAPTKKKLIGNDRMISIWPARGGPVLFDGKIYFAAGIWPFMGIFIYSIDAETGKVEWCNSGSGAVYTEQPHGSPAFGGIAPQGYLSATDDKLILSGRSVPSVYDRKTGKNLYYHHGYGKNKRGGCRVFTGKNWFFVNEGGIYELSTGTESEKNVAEILTDEAFFFIKDKNYKKDDHETNTSWDTIIANGYSATKKASEKKNKKGEIDISYKYKFNNLWQSTLNSPIKKIMLKSGNSIFCSGANNEILSFNMLQRAHGPTWKANWKYKIKSNPWSMIAADQKLFVVGEKGTLYCFGQKKGNTVKYALNNNPLPSSKPESVKIINNILRKIPDKKGYCLVFGTTSGELINELIKQSAMHIIVLEQDTDKVREFRKKFDTAGFYGQRIAIFTGNISDLPPYFANLVILESTDKVLAKQIFNILRPYGGKSFFFHAGKPLDSLKKEIDNLDLVNSKTTLHPDDGYLELERYGRLPGAGSWTHQHADSANTIVSKDKLVKLPLGILWFGGPSNDKILPRHGHGPSPQIINGRLFIEGRDILRAVDVYTGRVLWEKEIANIGKFYDNTFHHPGANEIGGNYVSTEDAVYAITPENCLMIDPVTGKTIKQFTLPDTQKWGFIVTSGNYLLAASVPLSIPPFKKAKKQVKVRPNKVILNANYASASKNLSILDRYSGKILWTRKAEYNFRHNTIIIANNIVYCIDNISAKKQVFWRKSRHTDSINPVLYALDLKTGKVIWQTDKDVFGTWLGCSEKHNVLIQSGNFGGDKAADEPRSAGASAHNALTGKLLWKIKSIDSAPYMLHNDKIITQKKPIDYFTGQEIAMKNPFNSKNKIPWKFKRNYGCNTIIASENLLTFRSAAAGYFDLNTCSGIGNLGGFKSGCTPNLIAADGVLNAPDYTRTCGCTYQNQTSLAFVYMPEVELWTFSNLSTASAIKKIGLNFGAPGDRMSETGTFWLDIPAVGGPSPELQYSLNPSEPETFRNHSSLISGKGLKWVAASGIKGVKSIQLDFIRDSKCDIILYFSEPEYSQPDRRVFSVIIEGKQLLKSLDILKETKSKNKVLAKEFKNIYVKGTLEIMFKTLKGKSIISGIEITRH